MEDNQISQVTLQKLRVLRHQRVTRAKDFCCWPEFTDFTSSLRVQQIIQQKVRRNPANIKAILEMPVTVNEAVWKYEHLSQFCVQLNDLVTILQTECIPNPPGGQLMRKKSNFCTGIYKIRKYICHCTVYLNSSTYFPNRMVTVDSPLSILEQICVKFYRIFYHAYKYHLQVFEMFELETHLWERFKRFDTMYSILPMEIKMRIC